MSSLLGYFLAAFLWVFLCLQFSEIYYYYFYLFIYFFFGFLIVERVACGGLRKVCRLMFARIVENVAFSVVGVLRVFPKLESYEVAHFN